MDLHSFIAGAAAAILAPIVFLYLMWGIIIVLDWRLWMRFHAYRNRRIRRERERVREREHAHARTQAAMPRY